MDKQLIAQALQELTPEAIALLDEMDDDAIARYAELIEIYQQGLSADIGWLAVIENAMTQCGLPNRLAFGLAVCRDSSHFAKTRVSREGDRYKRKAKNAIK
ncbi:MAG: hypothetical protein ACRC62_23785 [Microcoleus sp.]